MCVVDRYTDIVDVVTMVTGLGSTYVQDLLTMFLFSLDK